MSTVIEPPEPLQADTVEARVLRKKIWKRLWKDNEHFMCVVVGREGSGKSLTGIKFGEVVDPTFTAERVMFEPASFLKRLQKWKAAGETQGKFVVIDEAGVGVGVRTWYDKDQVRFNQVLQIIRDENMGVAFTIPRLEELDSQTQGRLHAYLEMTEKKNGQWAKLKWLDWDPTRDGRNKIYREYDGMEINGHQRRVKRLCISPPSDDLVEAYEERKNEFQRKEYADAIDEMEDDVDDEKSVKDVAMDIVQADMSNYVSEHGQTGKAFINKELIRAHHDVTHRDAKAVKALLDQQFSSEELMKYA